MNRDWFAQTQPETRGRIQVALECFPQVIVDLHEMGGDDTYYFAPPADPLNPHIHQEPDRRRSTCSAAPTPPASTSAARRTSSARSTTPSIPATASSWPIFHGAIGMTYEQASARGLSFARSDGTG